MHVYRKILCDLGGYARKIESPFVEDSIVEVIFLLQSVLDRVSSNRAYG